MGEFDEAAKIVQEATRGIIAEEHSSGSPSEHSSGNPDGVATKSDAPRRSCWEVAAISLDTDLKGTLEKVKNRDLTGTVTGLVKIAEDMGAAELCLPKLDSTPLEKAIEALCPTNWDAIEDQLKTLTEAYERCYLMKPELA
jgi:hypothetical protein